MYRIILIFSCFLTSLCSVAMDNKFKEELNARLAKSPNRPSLAAVNPDTGSSQPHHHAGSGQVTRPGGSHYKKDDESSIKSNPMLLPHQQENFPIREAMIDECVTQCIILKSPKLTNGELTVACLTLYPLYDRRRDFNLEKGVQDKSCENVCSLWWFSQSSRMNNERDSKGSRFRHDLVDISIDPVGKYWYDLVSKIKEDILESMDMYARFYGISHPRMDEFKKAITVNTVQISIDETTALDRKAATSHSLPLQKQKEVYAIREAMIDECINQYKVLTKKKLKKGEWVGACKKLYSLYDKRKEYIEEKNVDYETRGHLTGVASIFRHIDFVIRTISESRFKEEMEYFNLHMESFSKFKSDIREDILESMEMYERVSGKPHPRRAEFLKM